MNSSLLVILSVHNAMWQAPYRSQLPHSTADLIQPTCFSRPACHQTAHPLWRKSLYFFYLCPQPQGPSFHLVPVQPSCTNTCRSKGSPSCLPAHSRHASLVQAQSRLWSGPGPWTRSLTTASTWQRHTCTQRDRLESTRPTAAGRGRLPELLLDTKHFLRHAWYL